MQIKVVDQGIIFRNPLPGHRVINAFYPEVHCLAEGEWLCVLRVAGALYSPDGVLEMFRTCDGGKNWERQGPVCPRTPDPGRYNYVEGAITALRDGSLVLRAMRCENSNANLLAYNPRTQGLRPLETCLLRSSDQGRTWSEPVAPDIRSHFEAHQEPAPYGRVIELDDGTWFHTFETWKTYDDEGPFDLNIYGLLSRDGGRTWFGKAPVAVGTAENRSYSHGITVRCADGRLFLAAWGAEPQLQEFFGLYGLSSTDALAQRWTSPVPLGIPGQTSCPVEIQPGRLLIVYSHRDQTDQPGIKAVLSEDGGGTWPLAAPGSLAEPAILWDAYGKEALGVARSSTYPSSHDAIAYGAPKVTRLDDNHAMASFWCTQGGDTHCRWCKLRIV